MPKDLKKMKASRVAPEVAARESDVALKASLSMNPSVPTANGHEDLRALLGNDPRRPLPHRVSPNEDYATAES